MRIEASRIGWVWMASMLCAITTTSALATSFYVVAHPDDMELFMSASAIADFASRPEEKKVFVVMTAGDGGKGINGGLNGLPLWRARQDGHENAVMFLQSLTGSHSGKLVRGRAQLGARALQRTSFGDNAIMYSLLLPDGNLNGAGFPGTGNQSLAQLLSGKIASMRAIDGSAYSKADLVDLLSHLISYEAPADPVIWVNIQDPDPIRNPGDHSDHYATGQLLTEILGNSAFGCAQIAKYRGYAISGNKLVLNDNTMAQVAMFGALNIGLIAGGQGNEWESHNRWVGRQMPPAEEHRDGKCDLARWLPKPLGGTKR
jgi:LmbE family N-acetylglucosaminyl deacetylase